MENKLNVIKNNQICKRIITLGISNTAGEVNVYFNRIKM